MVELLNPSELETMVEVACIIANCSEVDEMELLEMLKPEQKKQVWRELEPEIRKQLAQLGVIRKQKLRRAA